MSYHMSFMVIILLSFAIAVYASPEDSTIVRQKAAISALKGNIFEKLNTASTPSKFFFAPSARVLNPLEVSLAGGSAFGVEEEGGFLGRAALGLGGVAEVEFSTTQVINQLTGHTTRFPTRAFKIQLVPDRLKNYWFIPNVIAQLRTTSWGSIVESGTRISSTVEEGFERANDYLRLTDLSTKSRFTTLYVAAGKEGSIGGITFGFSLTDVRTQEGWQNIYNVNTYHYDYVKLAKMKKEILKPFGGVFINANDKTQIMAELEAVPQFDYDYEAQKVRIRHAWLGITGVRFFLTNWLSWDTGVRYQSNFAGIADAEINIAANLIVPLKSAGR